MNKYEKVLSEDGFLFFNVLTKVPSEVLLSILKNMKKNYQTDEDGRITHFVEYKFEGVGDLTDFTNNKVRPIEKVFDSLLDTKVELSSLDFYKIGSLFSRYCFTKESTAKLFFSEDSLNQIILEESRNYGLVEVDKVSNFKEKYSKHFYSLFSQAKNTGIIEIKKEHLFEVLEIPASFEGIYFIDNVLNPSFEELEKHFEGLTLSNFEMSSTGYLPDVCKFEFKKGEPSKATNPFKGKTKKEIELLKHIMNS